MRVKQIKNLLAMRNQYHPILSRLFRKYNYFVISLFMNAIVGASCCLLLAVAFFGLQSFFSTLENANKILLMCSVLSLSFSFIFTIRTVYSFLYSGKDTNLLRTLPVTRSEVVFSNILYFYKKHIIVSIYLFAAAVVAILKTTSDFSVFFVSIVSAVFVPLVAIFLAVFFAFVSNILSRSIESKKRLRKLYFKKHEALNSLVRYEFRNLSQFSSLKVEIIMQIFSFVAFTFVSAVSSPRFLAALVVYPALGMINVSSFSREGDFHNILETLPISDKKRFLSKIIFYSIIILPLFFAIFLFASYKTKDFSIILKILPVILFVVNISFLGLKADRKNPKTHWTNPQEAFRMNFPVFFASIFIGVVTAASLFFPEFVFLKNEAIGFLFSVVFNLFFFAITFLRR